MPEVRSRDGVTICYEDLGPRDGVPVVLCHGLGAAGEQLLADAGHFAGLGYRVLVPDLRGHGRSGKPERLGVADFALPVMAADLLAMLEQAETGPVHWVGNSLGGILALHLLGAHAQRLRTLATFGTAYRLDLPGWTAAAIPLTYRLLGRRLCGWMTALGTTRERSARPLIARLIADFDPEVGRCVAANLTRYDYTPTARAARLPILLLRGGRDRQVNRALAPTLAAMRGHPDFTLVELPEGGHCANLDAGPALRRELLAFWSRA